MRAQQPTLFVGVDPGASGGMAVLSASGKLISSQKMPCTEGDVWDFFVLLLKQTAEDGVEVRAAIEKVGGFVGQEQPGSAAFKFGYNAGLLAGCLTAAAIPFEAVTPQKWQRDMGIAKRDSKGGETKVSFKNRIKALAQRLHPREKVTLATADAIVIGEWLRRVTHQRNGGTTR